MLLTGCAGAQSALEPGGFPASDIAWLFWIFTGVASTVWLLVLVTLLGAFARRERWGRDVPARDESRERRVTGIIGACVAATAVIIVALTALSYFAQARIFGDGEKVDRLRVTGHQWWWDIEYLDEQPDRSFKTANDIRIAVGSPTKVMLATSDVIHSFWVPNLAGKTDQINGYANEQRLMATREGVYRGQCAEFCGRQHAHMAITVTAMPRPEFEGWLAAQREPGRAPETEIEKSGQRVFMNRGCMLCHTIRGTSAGGILGPDLTHLASRPTLAAGTLPNTPGQLAAWIVDPQSVKPGSLMPAMPIEAGELGPLVEYLKSLR